LNDQEELDALVGEVVAEWEIRSSCNSFDEVYVRCASGNWFMWYHLQDCCETVTLNEDESLESRLQTLVGETVAIHTCDESQEMPSDGVMPEYPDDSQTWTRYTIETESGKSASMLWVGTSNGYYSEVPHFGRTSAPLQVSQ